VGIGRALLKLGLRLAEAGLPEMVQWTMALAERERMRNRPRHVGLCARDRLDEGIPPGESGSDRRRKRASGAVRIARLDSCRPIFCKSLTVEQQIDDDMVVQQTLEAGVKHVFRKGSFELKELLAAMPRLDDAFTDPEHRP